MCEYLNVYVCWHSPVFFFLHVPASLLLSVAAPAVAVGLLAKLLAVGFCSLLVSICKIDRVIIKTASWCFSSLVFFRLEGFNVAFCVYFNFRPIVLLDKLNLMGCFWLFLVWRCYQLFSNFKVNSLEPLELFYIICCQSLIFVELWEYFCS